MLTRLLVALRGGRRLRGQSRLVAESPYLEILTRAASSLRLRAAPAVAWCQSVPVPTVIGILKPTILLPLSLSSGFPPEQIEMLLLHELAHLRRHDHWVNLAQWVIETVLFFHPAVWLISRRIRTERELACDDMVLSAGIKQTPYAESLLRMAELSRHAIAPEQISALALGSHGPRFSGFGQRILRLIEGRETMESIRPARVWPICVALLVLLAGCFSFALQGSAKEQAASHNPENPSGKITFTNGTRAELIGVAIPPNPRECWSPDGRRMLPVPKDYLDDVGRLSFGDKDKIYRDFFVRLQHLPDAYDVGVHYELEPSFGTSGGYHTKDGAIELGFVGGVDAKQRTTTLRLGVAAGAWKTLASSDGKGGSTSNIQEKIPYKVVFSDAIPHDHSVSIIVSHNLVDKDWRIVAVDEKNKIYKSNKSGTPGAKGSNFSQTSYEFMNVPQDVRFVRFDFQVRDYEWGKIEHIQLQPEKEISKSAVDRNDIENKPIITIHLKEIPGSAWWKLGPSVTVNSTDVRKPFFVNYAFQFNEKEPMIIKDLPTGRYRIEVVGFANPFLMKPVDLDWHNDKSKDIILEKGPCRLTGKISGRLDPKREDSLSWSGGKYAPGGHVNIDETGHYVFDGLLPGFYHICYRGKNIMPSYYPVQLKEGGKRNGYRPTALSFGREDYGGSI